MSDLETTPDRFITATKAKITAALALLGAGAGAATGFLLPHVGAVFSASPASPPLETSFLVAGIFAAIGAVLGPPIVWSAMRGVPLWRAFVEPAAAALLLGGMATVSASAIALPLALAGGIGAIWRLNRLYGDSDASDFRSTMPETSPEGSP